MAGVRHVQPRDGGVGCVAPDGRRQSAAVLLSRRLQWRRVRPGPGVLPDVEGRDLPRLLLEAEPELAGTPLRRQQAALRLSAAGAEASGCFPRCARIFGWTVPLRDLERGERWWEVVDAEREQR